MLEDQSLILSLITFEPVSPSIGNWYESQVHHKGGDQRAFQVFSLGAQQGEGEGLLYLAMQFLSLPPSDERTSFPSPALCLGPVNSDCTFREFPWFSWGHPCTHSEGQERRCYCILSFSESSCCLSFWPLAQESWLSFLL